MLSVELFFKAHNKPSFRLVRFTQIVDGLLQETFRIVWINSLYDAKILKPYDADLSLEITKEQYEKLYKELEGKINYVEKK